MSEIEIKEQLARIETKLETLGLQIGEHARVLFQNGKALTTRTAINEERLHTLEERFGEERAEHSKAKIALWSSLTAILCAAVSVYFQMK